MKLKTTQMEWSISLCIKFVLDKKDDKAITNQCWY